MNRLPRGLVDSRILDGFSLRQKLPPSQAVLFVLIWLKNFNRMSAGISPIQTVAAMKSR